MNTRLLKYASMLLIVLQLFVSLAQDSSHHTLTFIGKPDAESEQERLQLDMKLTDFEYTGLYLPANTRLEVHVKVLRSQRMPSLLVGTFDLDGVEPRLYELSLGENTITDEFGGVLYIRFHDPESKTRITFSEAALQVPTYTLGNTTQTAWQEQLAFLNLDVPSAVLLSKRVMMVVSRQSALNYQDKDQDVLLETFDHILEVEDTISGLDDSEPSPYRYLLVEHFYPEDYMFATDYRTAYSEEAISYILDPDLLIQDGWGPWHELGHTHQQAAWTWAALDEVTVNLYSLAVQRSFNQPSRMDENWSEVEAYLALPDGERNFNSDTTDVFVRLGMLEQLRLAFGDEFYQELHRQTRELKPNATTDAEKIAYFAYRTSVIAGRDLREFYEKWGLELSEQTLRDIAVLGLPVPEEDLTKLR